MLFRSACFVMELNLLLQVERLAVIELRLQAMSKEQAAKTAQANKLANAILNAIDRVQQLIGANVLPELADWSDIRGWLAAAVKRRVQVAVEARLLMLELNALVQSLKADLPTLVSSCSCVGADFS